MNTEAILDLAEFIEGLTVLDQAAIEVPPGRWFRMDVWLTSNSNMSLIAGRLGVSQAGQLGIGTWQ